MLCWTFTLVAAMGAELGVRGPEQGGQEAGWDEGSGQSEGPWGEGLGALRVALGHRVSRGPEL